MIKNHYLLCMALVITTILAACGEPAHDAEWYQKHDQARHEKLDKCTQSNYNTNHMKDCLAAKDAASNISMKELETDTGGSGTSGHDFMPKANDGK